MEGKTEMIIDTNNRSKRRLPSWMQSSDTSQSGNCGNLDKICSMSGRQKENLNVSKIESISNEIDVGPESKKNYSKKKVRKSKQRVSSKDSTPIFKRKFKEDEAKLTVEDLISIAEEFVSKDKAMQHDQPVARESKSFESSSIPTNSSVALELDFAGRIRSCRALSKCDQASHFELNTAGHNQTEKSASVSSSKSTQPGDDAAQDMLELFLGPLLKNAPHGKSDAEITRELPTST